MNRFMQTALIVAAMIVAAAVSSCTMGPDHTPDVQGHVASWGAPTFSARGAMLAPGTAPITRRTMLHE